MSVPQILCSWSIHAGAPESTSRSQVVPTSDPGPLRESPDCFLMNICSPVHHQPLSLRQPPRAPRLGYSCFPRIFTIPCENSVSLVSPGPTKDAVSVVAPPVLVRLPWFVCLRPPPFLRQPQRPASQELCPQEVTSFSVWGAQH